MTLTAQDRRDLIRRALKENESAIEFVSMLGNVTQAWDDLYDRDKYVSPARVNDAFEDALLHLATNPFYNQHFNALHMVVRMGINAWKDSNTLIERGDKEALALAFTLRDMIGEVLIASVGLVGGYDWMREISLQLRLEIINDESFEDFCRSLGHES